MKEYLNLFLAFFRIGLFTFGGGYAMLPLIEKETVEKYKWIDKDELLDIFSMSQCTPGVIAVNAATFIGNKTKGVLGAALATIGVITPSIIIITLIAALISNFADNPIVNHAFAGIRIAVAALVFSTCIKLFKSTIKMPAQIGIALAAFIMVAFFGSSTIVVILISALYGLFFIDLTKAKKAYESGTKGQTEGQSGEQTEAKAEEKVEGQPEEKGGNEK